MNLDEPNGPDAVEPLCDHLAGCRYEDLPATVVAAVKRSILDTLGCIFAGTACTDVVRMDHMVRGWAERPVATVLGSDGLKVSPASAVLLNGAAIHQYDFDDTHDRATCHPTSTSLVPALAAAEARGTASGRDLLRAVALGNEITSRVSGAIRGGAHDYPWFRAPVVGVFGATVAAATMLGADRRQLVEALGLALPMIGGTFASMLHPGSSVRSIRDGIAYRNGLLAAELAISGIRGDRFPLEGPLGFYRSYFAGEYDRTWLVGELGVRFEAERVSLKPWPSARHLHGPLTAVLDAVAHHRLSFDSIATVDVAVGRVNQARCRPVALRHDVDTHIDLLGNLPFAIANAILNGTLPLQVYRDAAQAQRVVNLALPKVRWHRDDRQDGPWTFEPGRVTLTTTDGRRIDAHAPVALGHPERPMSDARRSDKFLDCVANAASPKLRERAARIVDTVERLDTLERLDGLFALVG